MPRINLTSNFDFKLADYMSSDNGYLFKMSFLDASVKKYGFMFVPKSLYPSLLMLDFYLANKIEMSAEVQTAMEDMLKAELSADNGVILIADGTATVNGKDGLVQEPSSWGLFDNINDMTVANSVWVSKRLKDKGLSITDSKVSMRESGRNLYFDLADTQATRPNIFDTEVRKEDKSGVRVDTLGLSFTEKVKSAYRDSVLDLTFNGFVSEGTRTDTFDSDVLAGNQQASIEYVLDTSVLTKYYKGYRVTDNDLAFMVDRLLAERDTYEELEVDKIYYKAVNLSKPERYQVVDGDIIRMIQAGKKYQKKASIWKEVIKATKYTQRKTLMPEKFKLARLRNRQYAFSLFFADEAVRPNERDLYVPLSDVSERSTSFDMTMPYTTLAERSYDWNLTIDKEYYLGKRVIDNHTLINSLYLVAHRDEVRDLHLNSSYILGLIEPKHRTTAFELLKVITGVRDNEVKLHVGDHVVGGRAKSFDLEVGREHKTGTRDNAVDLYVAKNSMSALRFNHKDLHLTFVSKPASKQGDKFLYVPKGMEGQRDYNRPFYYDKIIDMEKAPYPAELPQYEPLATVSIEGDGSLLDYDLYGYRVLDGTGFVDASDIQAHVDRTHMASFLEDILAQKGFSAHVMEDMIYAILDKNRASSITEDTIFSVLNTTRIAMFMEELFARKGFPAHVMEDMIYAELDNKRPSEIYSPLLDFIRDNKRIAEDFSQEIVAMKARLDAFLEEGIVSDKKGFDSFIDDGLFARKFQKQSHVEDGGIESVKASKVGHVEVQVAADLAPDEAMVGDHLTGDKLVDDGIVMNPHYMADKPSDYAVIGQGDMGTKTVDSAVIGEDFLGEKPSDYAVIGEDVISNPPQRGAVDSDPLLGHVESRQGINGDSLLGQVDERGGILGEELKDGDRPISLGGMFDDPFLGELTKDMADVLYADYLAQSQQREGAMEEEKIAQLQDRMADLINEYIVADKSIERAGYLAELMELADRSHRGDALLSEEGFEKIARLALKEGLLTNDLLAKKKSKDGVRIFDAIVGNKKRDEAVQYLATVGRLSKKIAMQLVDMRYGTEDKKKGIVPSDKPMLAKDDKKVSFISSLSPTAYGLLYEDINPLHYGIPEEYVEYRTIGKPLKTMDGKTPAPTDKVKVVRQNGKVIIGDGRVVTEGGTEVVVPMANRWMIEIDAVKTVIEQIIEQYLKDKVFYDKSRCEDALKNMRERIAWWIRNQLKLSDHDFAQALGFIDNCIEKILKANTVGATVPTTKFYADFNKGQIFPDIGTGVFTNVNNTWYIVDDPFGQGDLGVRTSASVMGQQSFKLNVNTNNVGNISFQMYLFNPYSHAVGQVFIDGEEVWVKDTTDGGNYKFTFPIKTAGNHLIEWRFTNHIGSESFFYVDVITIIEDVPADPSSLSCPAPYKVHQTLDFHNDYDNKKDYMKDLLAFNSLTSMNDVPAYFKVGGSMEDAYPYLVHVVGDESKFGTDNMMKFNLAQMNMGQQSYFTLKWGTKARGRVTFDLLVDANQGNGLIFFINDIQVGGEWSRNKSWQTVTFYTPPTQIGKGPDFTFKWLVRKQNDLHFGEEAVYIRNVTYTAIIDPTFIDPKDQWYYLLGDESPVWGTIYEESKIRSHPKVGLGVPDVYEFELTNECDSTFSFGYSLGMDASTYEPTHVQEFFNDKGQGYVTGVSSKGSVGEGEHYAPEWKYDTFNDRVGTIEDRALATYPLATIPNAEYAIKGQVEIVCPDVELDHIEEFPIDMSMFTDYASAPWTIDRSGTNPVLHLENPSDGSSSTTYNMNFHKGILEFDYSVQVAEGDYFQILIDGEPVVFHSEGVYEDEHFSRDMWDYGDRSVAVTFEYYHEPVPPMPEWEKKFSYRSQGMSFVSPRGSEYDIDRMDWDARDKSYAEGERGAETSYVIKLKPNARLTYSERVQIFNNADLDELHDAKYHFEAVNGKHWRKENGDFIDPPNGDVIFRETFNPPPADPTDAPPEDVHSSWLDYTREWKEIAIEDLYPGTDSGREDGALLADTDGKHEITIDYDTDRMAKFEFEYGGQQKKGDTLLVYIDDKLDRVITDFPDTALGESYVGYVPKGRGQIRIVYINDSAEEIEIDSPDEDGGTETIPARTNTVILDYSQNPFHATTQDSSYLGASSSSQWERAKTYNRTYDSGAFVTRKISASKNSQVTFTENVNVYAGTADYKYQEESTGKSWFLGDCPTWWFVRSRKMGQYHFSFYTFTVDGEATLDSGDAAVLLYKQDYADVFLLNGNVDILGMYDTISNNKKPFGSTNPVWSTYGDTVPKYKYLNYTKRLKKGTYTLVTRLQYNSGISTTPNDKNTGFYYGTWGYKTLSQSGTRKGAGTGYAVISIMDASGKVLSSTRVNGTDNPVDDGFGKRTKRQYSVNVPAGQTRLVQVTYYGGANQGDGLCTLTDGKMVEKVSKYVVNKPPKDPDPEVITGGGGGFLWVDTLKIIQPFDDSDIDWGVELRVYDNKTGDRIFRERYEDESQYMEYTSDCGADITIVVKADRASGYYAWLTKGLLVEEDCAHPTVDAWADVWGFDAIGKREVFGGGCQGSSFSIRLIDSTTGAMVDSRQVPNTGITDFSFSIPNQYGNPHRYRVEVSFTQAGGQKAGLEKPYYDTGYINQLTMTEIFHYPPPEFNARLEFYIDGKLMFSQENKTAPYATVAFPVPKGTHKYKFVFYELSPSLYDYAEIGWIHLTNWECRDYILEPYCKKGSGSKCIEELIKCLLKILEDRKPVQINAESDIWLFLI